MHGLEDKNFYELLGIGRDATTAEIKAAYHDLARLFHPDSHFYEEIAQVELTDKHHLVFKMITEAYNTLIHEKKRFDYDQTLTEEYYEAESVDMSDSGGRFRRWDDPGDEGRRATRVRSASQTWGSFGVVLEEIHREARRVDNRMHELNSRLSRQQGQIAQPDDRVQSVREMLDEKRISRLDKYIYAVFLLTGIVVGVGVVLFLFRGS